MSKWSVHSKIKVTAILVAMVCVPAKLSHVFTVGSLGYAQRSFGEVAKFPFWARTKLQKMATPVYYATHCTYLEYVPSTYVLAHFDYVKTYVALAYIYHIFSLL
jgi:hypothetical protein